MKYGFEKDRTAVAGLLLAGRVLMACRPDGDATAAAEGWQLVGDGLPAALLSISGRGPEDVWVAGADAGDGPWLAHYEGTQWRRRRTGDRGHLWWVHAAPDGSVVTGGADGRLLTLSNGRWTTYKGPGGGTVFGVWANSADDAWAVGARDGVDGFLWRLRDGRLEEVALPDERPRLSDGRWPALFKVWRGAGGLWVVGDQGTVLRSEDGVTFTALETGTRERLFTVHGDAEGPVIVGGTSSGLILEGRLGPEGWALTSVSPRAAPLLQGVFAEVDGTALAVGLYGMSFDRRQGAWSSGTRAPVRPESLHAAWSDGNGASWACGGGVMSTLDRGVLLVRGTTVAPLAADVEVEE